MGLINTKVSRYEYLERLDNRKINLVLITIVGYLFNPIQDFKALFQVTTLILDGLNYFNYQQYLQIKNLYTKFERKNLIRPIFMIRFNQTPIFAVSKTNEKIIPCILDVPYSNSVNEKLNIFGTNLPEESPIFVYIHGGYWQDLSRDISAYPVKPFYEKRIKVVIIGYDLCPNVTLHEICDQINKALIFCLNYAKLKKSGLGNSVYAQHTSSCGFSVDEDGLLGFSCKFSAERFSRHHEVNDLIKRAFSSSGIPSILKPLGTSRDDGKKPNGMPMIPWNINNSLIWDFTCIDTMTPSFLKSSSR